LTLYDLTAEYKELLDLLSDPEHESFEDDIKDKLAVTESDLEDKADAYAKFIKTLEAQANAIKTEEERLNARRKTLENRVDYMKKSLEDSMVFLDMKKFKTTLFSFNIQKNPPAVNVFDERIVPDEYYKQPAPALSKTLIFDALNKGVAVPGAELIQRESLRIR